MKYVFEMGSGAMIYMPSFIKTDSGIQNRRDSQTYRQYGDRKSLLSFSQSEESRLKIYLYSLFMLSCILEATLKTARY
jgi:hypothetical protein